MAQHKLGQLGWAGCSDWTDRMNDWDGEGVLNKVGLKEGLNLIDRASHGNKSRGFVYFSVHFKLLSFIIAKAQI